MAIKASTQQHLDVLDVRDGILILTGGRFRAVLEASAINFDLLSEAEQDAAIFAYRNLVNSLDFPIQVVVRTRQVDITSYVEFLKDQLKEQPSSSMREQLQSYIEFVEQLVLENTVLSKRFFVVLPYWKMEVRSKGSGNLLDPIREIVPFLEPKAEKPKYSETAFADAKRVFEQRRESMAWQFRRLGVQVRQLSDEELVRLFYEIYNPEAGENEALQQDLDGYLNEYVETAIQDEPEIEVPAEEQPDGISTNPS